MVYAHEAEGEKSPLLPQHQVTKPSASKATLGRDGFPDHLRGKRILLATESLGPVNGVSRTTLSLITYLRANGANVVVVAPKIDKERFKLGPLGYANVRLQGQPLPYNPELTVVHPFRYDRICSKTFKPDLVYLASPASVGFQFLLQIRQLQEPPAVVCNFQTDLSAYGEIIFPPGMDRFAVWLLDAVQGFLFKHRSVYSIFYPCSDIRKYLEKVGAPSNKLTQVGRGVDTSMFNTSHRDEAYRQQLAPNGEIILTCISRLAPEKGFEFLARVAERLVEAGLNFKLMIVGGNRNPAVEEEVQNYFSTVKDRVIFTGCLTGVSLARAYAAGDLFLHCSVTETFGLVVLEAMASGMPVIARDQGGPSEIVRHGQSGYLVPPQDLEMFVKQTLLVCRNNELRAELSAAALLQADATTWDKINQRVAWKLADGIDWNAEQILARKNSRPIRNWLYAQYYDVKLALFLPLLQMLSLHAALGIVCFFWLIAVLPLIIHGNSAFPISWNGFRVVRGWIGRARVPLLRR